MKTVFAYAIAATLLVGCGRNSDSPAPRDQAPQQKPAAPNQIEFKGAVLGQPIDKGMDFGSEDCKRVLAKGSGACLALTTYGQATPKHVSVHIDGGRLHRVSVILEPQSFDDVLAALIQKYGPPTSESSSELSNAMGAKFRDVVAQWVAKDGSTVYAQKYVGDILTSAVALDSAAANKEMMDRAQRRGPKASDL